MQTFSSPLKLRQSIRAGLWRGHTVGQVPRHVQGNLVILPKAWADDFLLFCLRNPKPCPLLAVGDVGKPMLTALGHDLDIRSDLPRYRVWREGVLEGTPDDPAYAYIRHD
jgi:uncharacterized protein YcsI (UPF0317 family)